MGKDAWKRRKSSRKGLSKGARKRGKRRGRWRRKESVAEKGEGIYTSKE